MISKELISIINEIKKKDKMSFVNGIADDEILAFEKEKSIVLPSKYKEWLEFSDGGELYLPAGVQLYGVAHQPLINEDNDSRPSEDYVVIGALATGDPILFKKNSELIAIYNQQVGRIEDDEVYEDFFAFLKDLHDLLGIGE